LENQIAALQQEKDELASLLAQASSNVNACKISEQRRKRLQELEPQISELKKKIQEQANIIKLKREFSLNPNVYQTVIVMLIHFFLQRERKSS
jgi:predicted RNase H-like nuclease (RuvC/YqgF family)